MLLIRSKQCLWSTFLGFTLKFYKINVLLRVCVCSVSDDNSDQLFWIAICGMDLINMRRWRLLASGGISWLWWQVSWRIWVLKQLSCSLQGVKFFNPEIVGTCRGCGFQRSAELGEKLANTSDLFQKVRSRNLRTEVLPTPSAWWLGRTLPCPWSCPWPDPGHNLTFIFSLLNISIFLSLVAFLRLVLLVCYPNRA